MAIRLSGFSGCAAVLLVVFGPALLVAYLSHSLVWLIVVPFVIILLALLVAAIPSKRKLTPEQFADKLERHLHGTEGPLDWDDITSVAIADERLERIRWKLSRFDSLSREREKEELKVLIAAIRRGELPEVIPPNILTYSDADKVEGDRNPPESKRDPQKGP
jgi:hypothetical protein